MTDRPGIDEGDLSNAQKVALSSIAQEILNFGTSETSSTQVISLSDYDMLAIATIFSATDNQGGYNWDKFEDVTGMTPPEYVENYHEEND